MSTIYMQILYATELKAYKKQKISREKIDSGMRQEKLNFEATKVETVTDPNLGRVFNALV